jgi:YD repeat-containing protein
VQAETLEARLLLTTAVNDSYNVTHDHTLSGQNVIANDIHGGPLMNPSLVSGVSHGGLTFNSDGSFSYVPNTHYVGSDSFTYKDWDGFSWSNTATVSIGVNNSAPSAVNDSYTVYTNSLDSAAAGAASLLANDTGADSDTLTASLVTAPSHGTLTVNADGSFVYTKTAGYFGSDSAVYAASDGIASTNATISFTDTSPFSAQTNAPDQPFAGILSQGAFSTSQLTGEAQTGFALGQGHGLAYSSLTSDVKPIIAVETTYQGSGVVPTPDSIDLSLTFGGVTAPTLYFNNAGLTPGDTVRFAQQVDASSLATGHYQYTMTLTSHYGSTTSTRTFTGYQDIVNRQSSEFGPGWSLAEVDKLAVGTGGVLWAGGAGGTAWFTDTGSGTYSSPAGPMAFSTVAKSGSTYTLTDKFGNVENFDSTGLLTSKVDSNGNTTSYAYSSGKLSTVTDPFGRTTTFNYTSGLVTSVTDIAGRTTTLAYTSGNLTSITAPDPDGTGPLSAPSRLMPTAQTAFRASPTRSRMSLRSRTISRAG